MRARFLLLGGAALAVAMVLGGWRLAGPMVEIVSHHAAEWREGGALVLLAFALIQMAVAAFGFLPASLTGIAIGFVLGFAYGLPIAASGTLAGAALAFLLARSALRPRITRSLAKRGFSMDSPGGMQGWRFVFLLRLSPVLPFAPASYALGIMGLAWRDYLIGTLASLPALAGYVWLGSVTTMLGQDWRSLSHPVLSALFWIGSAATLVLLVQMGGRLIAARQSVQAP